MTSARLLERRGEETRGTMEKLTLLPSKVKPAFAHDWLLM
jgi:hypothetical protein